MPPSRIPLTFPPRTRSRSSTKSSSSSSSGRLSKAAVLPSGNAFTPSSVPRSSTHPAQARSGASSEGSGSRAGSPALSSVSGGGSGVVPGGGSQQGSEDTKKRAQSLGGVANLPSILVSCLNPPSYQSLSNDRFSPPVHIPYVAPPAPKLFPSNPATPSRRATEYNTRPKTNKPQGVLRRNTTGNSNTVSGSKSSSAAAAKSKLTSAAPGPGPGAGAKAPLQPATKKKRKSTLSSEAHLSSLAKRHQSTSSSTLANHSTSNQTSASSSVAVTPHLPHQIKPAPARRPSNLSSEITAQISAAGGGVASSPPRPSHMDVSPSMPPAATVSSRGGAATVADGSSPITLHSVPASTAGESLQLVHEGGRVVGGVRV